MSDYGSNPIKVSDVRTPESIRTWCCEGNQLHTKWPQMDDVMLEFLASSNSIRK